MRPRQAPSVPTCGCSRRLTTVSGSESCVASAGDVSCVVDVKLAVTTRNFAVSPGNNSEQNLITRRIDWHVNLNARHPVQWRRSSAEQADLWKTAPPLQHLGTNQLGRSSSHVGYLLRLPRRHHDSKHKHRIVR